MNESELIIFQSEPKNLATFHTPHTLNWIHGGTILTSSQHLEQSASHLTYEEMNEWVTENILLLAIRLCP